MRTLPARGWHEAGCFRMLQGYLGWDWLSPPPRRSRRKKEDVAWCACQHCLKRRHKSEGHALLHWGTNLASCQFLLCVLLLGETTGRRPLGTSRQEAGCNCGLPSPSHSPRDIPPSSVSLPGLLPSHPSPGHASTSRGQGQAGQWHSCWQPDPRLTAEQKGSGHGQLVAFTCCLGLFFPCRSVPESWPVGRAGVGKAQALPSVTSHCAAPAPMDTESDTSMESWQGEECVQQHEEDFNTKCSVEAFRERKVPGRPTPTQTVGSSVCRGQGGTGMG